MAINNMGIVVGNSDNADGEDEGFVWRDGVMNGVGAGDLDRSSCTFITEHGMAVGRFRSSDNQTSRAFIWLDGVITELPTLGGATVTPYAGNIHGHIVGEAKDETETNRGFWWKDSTMQQLPDGFSPRFINDTGMIAGYHNGQVAVYVGNEITTIADVLPPSTNGSFTAVLSLSNSGYMGLYGEMNGETGGFIAQVVFNQSRFNLDAEVEDLVSMGSELEYRFSYDLIGAYADNAALQSTLPNGTEFISASTGGVLDGNTVRWELGSLSRGAAGTVSMVVRVDSTAPIVNDDYAIAADNVPTVPGISLTTSVRHLVLDSPAVIVEEGGQATARVRLSPAPTEDVTLSIARTSGDSDLNTTIDTLLIPQASDSWHDINITAAVDNDAQAGAAKIQLSGDEYGTINLAVIERDPDLTAVLLSTNGGTTTPSGQIARAPNSTLDVTATPASGYSFSHWTGTIATEARETNPVAIQMTADVLLTAHFQEDADVDGDGLSDAWEQTHFATLDHGADDDPNAVGMPLSSMFANSINPLTGGPEVSFATNESTVLESAGSAAIELTLSVASATTVTVNLEATGGTATLDGDYELPGNMSLVFEPGETTKLFELTILNDDLFEQGEFVRVEIATATGALPVEPTQHTVHITNHLAAGSTSDTDADGLPDAWEQQFFGHLDFDADDDSDDDGVDNLTEYRQGMHPDVGFRMAVDGEIQLRVLTPLQ